MGFFSVYMVGVSLGSEVKDSHGAHQPGVRGVLLRDQSYPSLLLSGVTCGHGRVQSGCTSASPGVALLTVQRAQTLRGGVQVHWWVPALGRSESAGPGVAENPLFQPAPR